ncbi:MAG: RICIN domain-containing protein, partial [Ruminococcus sp.]
AAQLYASADIAPEFVQSEAVQETSAQSTAQETTETSVGESNTVTAESTSATTYTSTESSLSAESEKIKSAVSTVFKSENADEEQSGKLTTVNSPMLTSISGLGEQIDLGADFYANISYKDFNLTIGEDLGSGNYDVLIKEKDGSTKQIWHFQRRTDGAYKITNVNSNSCLDVKEQGDNDGQNVGVWKDNGTPAQIWSIYQKSNGDYVLSPKFTTTRVLNVNQGLAESGTTVDIWTYADEERCAFSINNISMSLDGDIDTVTNDSIKFQLFDYDQDINYINDVKTTTDTYKYDPGQPTKYTRELTKYFAFHGIDNANHHTYRPPSSGDTEANPYIGTVEAYDERVFLPNHATVERTLDNNGFPVVNVTRNAYGVENAKTHSFLKPTISYDDRKIDYLFGGKEDESVTKYTPNNSLLYKTADGHYHYNSAEHAVDYDADNDMFRVKGYTESGTATANYSEDEYKDIDGNAFSDFLPFNQTNGVPVGQDITTGRYYNVLDSEINYWFGMRMDVDFIQGADGKSNDEDIIFKFSGDDDVWVFIDDVLVLDLGGSHGACVGTINFATGEVDQYFYFGKDGSKKEPNTQWHYTTTLKDCFENAGNKSPNGSWNSTGTTFADYTSHKLSFFYLERGAGNANCSMDFNLPIPLDSSFAVEKQVKASNGNNIDDNTDYTFRLTGNSDNITTTDLTNITKYNKDGSVTIKTADGVTGDSATLGTLVESGSNSYYEFKLKNKEKIFFESLRTGEYQIEEVTDGQSFVKSTTSEIVGQAGTGDTYGGEVVNITLTTNDSKTVKFTNTLKSLTVNLKYYGRETVNGKPTDLKSTPTTYTKSYIKDDYLSYIDKDDPIGSMITDTGVKFGETYNNVLDEYILWTSQKQAESGIANLVNSGDEIVSKKYSEAQKSYHGDRYGNPTTENWYTYKYIDTTKNTDYENSENKKTDCENVSQVTIWLFNTPKQYDVYAYEAKNANDLTKVSDGTYVANTNLHGGAPIKAYYNQRLGVSIGEAYDTPNSYLTGYGIDKAYTDTKLETAPVIGDRKFAYWSFDMYGKTIASTDIRYNYRITKNTKLYAVYNSDGKVNGGNVGLTVSMDDPDVYFNSQGVSLTRLNTVMNPYNCKDEDENIRNVAAVYLISTSTSPETLIGDELDKIKTAITNALPKITKDESFKTNIGDSSASVIDLSEIASVTKGNYYVYYVDGFGSGDEGDTILTNKNRIEFTLPMQTSALKKRRMFAFAAMLYGDDPSVENANNTWYVSDNYIDYTFTSAGSYTSVNIMPERVKYVFDAK